MLKIKGKNSKDTVFFEVSECTGKPAWYSDLCLERPLPYIALLTVVRLCVSVHEN